MRFFPVSHRVRARFQTGQKILQESNPISRLLVEFVTLEGIAFGVTRADFSDSLSLV